MDLGKVKSNAYSDGVIVMSPMRTISDPLAPAAMLLAGESGLATGRAMLASAWVRVEPSRCRPSMNNTSAFDNDFTVAGEGSKV